MSSSLVQAVGNICLARSLNSFSFSRVQCHLAMPELFSCLPDISGLQGLSHISLLSITMRALICTLQMQISPEGWSSQGRPGLALNLVPLQSLFHQTLPKHLQFLSLSPPCSVPASALSHLLTHFLQLFCR